MDFPRSPACFSSGFSQVHPTSSLPRRQIWLLNLWMGKKLKLGTIDVWTGLSPKLTKMDRTLMCWWLFTGLTHMIIEGYFVFSPEFFAKESPMILSEICKILRIHHHPLRIRLINWSFIAGKEYGKGDSRYVSRDSAVVSVEGITAVLTGPASFLSLYESQTLNQFPIFC